MHRPSSSKVLVIDDERAVRENIAAYLEDSDFSVFQAENGRVGLNLFRDVNPDVVLVDLDMPEVNGFEVLVEVKKASEEIPVVIVSGAGEVTNAIEASRLGAWDFVLKPIHNMAVVEHTIFRVLDHRKLLRENREYKEDLEKKVQERTISLELKTGELQEANKQLRAEIEERRLAEARLRQAKERSVALRRFSNRISEFSDEARLLEAALEELCANIYLSGAALFHSFKADQLTRCLPGSPSCKFLNKLPGFDLIRQIFKNRSQEIVVYNNITKQSPLYDFYCSQDSCPDDIEGSHFAFIRGKALHHHLFCFYRDALYAPFYNLDIEYMRSMVNEINTAYSNIQVISANSWLERRLRSIVPADRQNLLMEMHDCPGFSVATSVYPSYEIKAEWHTFIPVDSRSSGIMMSDVPGTGMSDVMYNEMATDHLLRDKSVMTNPAEVMAALNENLQTDFHPNRQLTLNFFLFHGDNGTVEYSNLGDDTMSLMRFDGESYQTIHPKKSPFLEIYIDSPEAHFPQEQIQLSANHVMLGFTRRLADNTDPLNKALNLEGLSKVITDSMSRPIDELMGAVMSYLLETTPRENQVNDSNLILIRRNPA